MKKFFLLLVVSFLCPWLYADENIELKHVMISLPENRQPYEMPIFLVYTLEDVKLNKEIITFDKLIQDRTYNEKGVSSRVVTPLVDTTERKSPQMETFYVLNGKLYVRHTIENGQLMISTQIARLGRSSGYAAPNHVGKYQNYRAYELVFEPGVMLKGNFENGSRRTDSFVLNIQSKITSDLKEKRIEEFRQKILNNTPEQLTAQQKNELLKRYPGLKISINEFIKLFTDQTSSLQLSKSYNKEQINDMREKIYGLAYNVDSLYFRNHHNVARQHSFMLKGASRWRLNSEHVNERVFDTMNLFFKTIYDLEKAVLNKQSERVHQLTFEAIRVLSEAYILAGRNKGSIGQERIYAGITSMFLGMTFLSSLTFVDINEVRILLASLAGIFVAHSFYNLVVKNHEYRESRFSYPWLKAVIQKSNTRQILENTLNIGYESGLRYNPTYVKSESLWSQHAFSNNIFETKFMHRVIPIVQMASGKDALSVIHAFNSHYQCRLLF